MDLDLINRFLNDREQRVYHQEKLMKEYSGRAFVTVRVNYPGVEKSSHVTDSIARIIIDEICVFNKKCILFHEEYINMEGVIGHFVMDCDPLEIKRDMVELEGSHILGRCVDIDVYGIRDGRMYGLSRSDLNIGPRKCFLCEESAKICSRAQNHSLSDIKRYFEDKYSEYVDFEKEKKARCYELSNMALKAIIEEVSTMPSFGLVSPSTMGSHKDMDYYTFLDSSFAIAPYLKDMAERGYSFHSPKEIFEAIRPVGIEAEKEMFKVTGGVNTHKGMIFLIGVIISAVAKTIYDKRGFEAVTEVIAEMCSDILRDFDGLEGKIELTHGEKLYLKYGFTGIRGEVQKGLGFLFKDILPFYECSDLKGNHLFAETLLRLMAVVDDSTIVHRQDIEVLNYVKKRSKEILLMGGMTTEKGRLEAEEFEKYCIRENISPGGSADLLAAVIFLSYVKNNF